MNPLDWLLAILLVYSVTRAAMRGFFAEAFALGGLVFGFLFACWFYRDAGTKLTGLISSLPLAQMVAFLCILAGTMVLASVIGKLLRRTASAVGLGLLDRFFGAIFGLLRGALLGSSLLLAVTAFLPASAWVAGSRIAPPLLNAAHAVSFVMPTDLKRRFNEGVERVKHTGPDWIKPGFSSHNQGNAKSLSF